MNFKFWEWPHQRRIRHLQEFDDLHEAFIQALTKSMQYTVFTHNTHVTYSARPPAPRPIQLTLLWTFSDGHQHRQFFNLNGQSWIESVPSNFIWSEDPRDRPVSIEAVLTYKDTGSPVN